MDSVRKNRECVNPWDDFVHQSCLRLLQSFKHAIPSAWIFLVGMIASCTFQESSLRPPSDTTTNKNLERNNKRPEPANEKSDIRTVWNRFDSLLAHHAGADALAISPDGMRMASSGRSGEIRLSGVDAAGTPVSWPAGSRSIMALAFSPDGRTLAAGIDGGAIILWAIETRSERLRFRADEVWISALAFSPDGTILASGGKDCSVRFWDPAGGREFGRLAGHEAWVSAAAFSPDGRTLATGGEDCTVMLWETATGEPVRKLQGHRSRVGSVAFSSDGRTIASGGHDDAIRFWDVDTGKPLDRIPGQQRPVLLLGFPPGDRRLVRIDADLSVDARDVSGAIRRAPPSAPPDAQGTPKLWEYMAVREATNARLAIRTLADAGDAALADLQARLLPPPPGPAEAARLRRRIVELDHDEIEMRDAASRELRAFGYAALPALQATLETSPSAEVRARIEALVDLYVSEAPFPIPPGEPLRRHRSMQVLERIGTPAARETLEAMARGSPSARERREARAALDRLGRRTKAGE
jgi:hypothetical protein